jgi:hypothetical protein
LSGVLCFFRWVWDAGFPVGQGAGFPVVGVGVVVADLLSFRRSNGFRRVSLTGDRRVFLSIY